MPSRSLQCAIGDEEVGVPGFDAEELAGAGGAGEVVADRDVCREGFAERVDSVEEHDVGNLNELRHLQGPTKLLIKEVEGAALVAGKPRRGQDDVPPVRRVLAQDQRREFNAAAAGRGLLDRVLDAPGEVVVHSTGTSA